MLVCAASQRGALLPPLSPLPPLLLLLAGVSVRSEVLVEHLEGYNIGYGRGSGKEAPGTAVANYPGVIFHGKVDSAAACEVACVADLKCTGFVWTDTKQRQPVYDQTCYFRVDGCHPGSPTAPSAAPPPCDKLMRAEKDHTSGYLYCSDTPAGPETAAALDACGHFEASGAGVTFVAAFAVCSAIYLGGGAAHRYRQLGGKHRSVHELLPHRQMWGEVAGLVSDGISFVRGGNAKGGRAGYRPVDSASAERGEGKKEKGEKRRGKKEKKEKPERKKGESESKSRSRGGEDNTSPPAAPTPEAAGGGSGGGGGDGGKGRDTASAGGGRWVHVPG